MAGEYEDYRRSEDEIRRSSARQHGFWYRPKVPLWKKILKAAYWLAVPLFLLVAAVAFSVSHGILACFAVIAGVLLVVVGIPLLFWLIQKHTGL